MKRLFRPSLLAALAGAVLAGAAALINAWLAGPAVTRPAPLPVAGGDREVAWLYAATSTNSWERFVSSVRRTADRLQESQPGLEAQTGAAFPPYTASVPEVALAWPGGTRRLVFRWYKLTSDWSPRDWTEALLERAPPPLAIIGGSSSEGARELAGQLDQAGAALPDRLRPLLLLTQATADRVPSREAEDSFALEPPPFAPQPADEPEGAPGVPLNRVYDGRTFRYCFTNRQMAGAVTDFLWGQDDLRPDCDPVYMVQWDDDSYSRDLIEGFWKALRSLAVQDTVREWSWVSAAVQGGFPPSLGGGSFPVHRAGRRGSGLDMSILPTPQRIDSSVGSFITPNPYESSAARYLLDLLQARRPPQRRPLLVLTGQSQPTRRFLRAVERSAPAQARRFVVATGDTISFNAVYRDRRVSWPVQDLPFALVFFCHHNPVDADAGFRRGPGRRGSPVGFTAATGTEDVLLYGEIVESLAQALVRDGREAGDAAELAERLVAVRLRDGRVGFDASATPLFRPDGKRYPGTSEHVVCLRPQFHGGRVLPEARIEVWAWRSGAAGQRSWQPCGEPLTVRYDELPSEGGGTHAGD